MGGSAHFRAGVALADALNGGGRQGEDKGKGKRAGEKPISEELRLKIITKTIQERPANATHWSVRTMAKEMDVSCTTVQRIWKASGLKPHLTRTC
jgi:hypothetical protein